MKKPVEKQCGPCRACCVELKIVQPGFFKDAGVLCPHHTGTGCGIYASRYEVCRGFLCGWRQSAELGPDWRPDLSGVMIVRDGPERLAQQYRAAGYGLHFMITGGEAAIRRPAFLAHVTAEMARGVAVRLSASSPAILLNDYLDPVAAARRPDSILDLLLRLHGLLRAGGWNRNLFARLGPLYRLQVERLRFQAARKYKLPND